MAKGPHAGEKFGEIVFALHQSGVEVVVGGHWSIAAFDAEHPLLETQTWLKENPPVGFLDIACPEQHRAAAESVLMMLGFRLQEKSPEEMHFEDSTEHAVRVSLFRPARDGGRIYPQGGPDGEDWYFRPECVTSGRLGSVPVRTEGPEGLEKARAALSSDET
jgi:hypothetical protein